MTRNMIRIQALAKTIEMKTTNLYASNNWCTRFLNRNNSHTSPEVKNCSKAAHGPRREDQTSTALELTAGRAEIMNY